jgi:hypothetical protein
MSDALNEHRELRLVAKLIQLTRARKIEWVRVDRRGSLAGSAHSHIVDVYEAELDGDRLRIYEVPFQAYSDEFNTSYWSSKIMLELIDQQGFSQWEVVGQAELLDLWRAVRFIAGNVERRIDRMLSLKVD